MRSRGFGLFLVLYKVPFFILPFFFLLFHLDPAAFFQKSRLQKRECVLKLLTKLSSLVRNAKGLSYC